MAAPVDARKTATTRLLPSLFRPRHLPAMNKLAASFEGVGINMEYRKRGVLSRPRYNHDDKLSKIPGLPRE